MNVTPKQQVKKLVDVSSKILVVSHANIDGDGLGSGIALAKALQKMGKQATFVYPDPLPEVYDFLPGTDEVATSFDGGRDFVLEIDCLNTEIDKLKYKMEGDKMKIFITPKGGTFSKEDVNFSQGGAGYDLVFVLDSSNLELVGKLYEENVDFFYEVPIINVDHHASNEYFGKVNIVDVTATSTAEIIVSILEALSPTQTLLDEDISTCLLNGIVTDTGSFQNSNTTPKAFSVAAQLLAAGARQQEIIKHVFKTKELSTLKLWGITLSKIESDPDYKIVWSTINRNDLEESQAKETEISGVIDELMSSAPEADLVLLLKEGPDNLIRGSLRSTNQNLDVAKIAALFDGGGHKRASGFRYKAESMEKGEQEILKRIREYIDNFRDEIPPQAKVKTSPVPKEPPDLSEMVVEQPVKLEKKEKTELKEKPITKREFEDKDKGEDKAVAKAKVEDEDRDEQRKEHIKKMFSKMEPPEGLVVEKEVKKDKPKEQTVEEEAITQAPSVSATESKEKEEITEPDFPPPPLGDEDSGDEPEVTLSLKKDEK